MPPMRGSGHHLFELEMEVEVEVEKGVPVREYVSLVLRLGRAGRGCGEGGRRVGRKEESGKRVHGGEDEGRGKARNRRNR
jgi:hypothetical protein